MSTTKSKCMEQGIQGSVPHTKKGLCDMLHLGKNVNTLGVAPQDAIVTTRSSHCITFFETFTPKEYDDVFVRIPFESRCFSPW